MVSIKCSECQEELTLHRVGQFGRSDVTIWVEPCECKCNCEECEDREGYAKLIKIINRIENLANEIGSLTSEE